jgi:hypothetical protein
MRLRQLLVAAAVIQALGCIDSAGPSLTVTGEWTGVANGRTVILTLTDTEGTIGGTGSITAPQDVLNCSGSRTGREVFLDVLIGGGPFSVFTLEGTIRGDVIVASLTGAGFDDTSVQLARE